MRRPSWRRWLGSALALVLLALLIEDVHHGVAYDDTYRAVQQSKIWRVGIDISNPPFASEPDGQTLAGLDIDLAHALADRLGVRLQVVALGYDGLYDALKVGSADSLISALSVNPAYYGDVIYSSAYFDNGLVIASRAGTVQQMADLEGRRVAVEYGAAADELLRLWARRLHHIDILHYPTAAAALDAARSGQADAALVDMITARLYLRATLGLTFSAQQTTADPYAVAVRRDSPFLAAAINAALETMRADGSLEAIIRRWL